LFESRLWTAKQDPTFLPVLLAIFLCHVVVLAPLLNAQLKGSVGNKVAKRERLSRHGASTVSFGHPFKHRSSLKVEPVAAHEWIEHDVLGDRADKVNGNIHLEQIVVLLVR
jgi:hypothetical protein